MALARLAARRMEVLRMSEERIILSACVTTATKLTPLIVRGCVNAAHSSKPHAARKRYLNAAINSTTLLLEELKLQQERLGWREDAA
jgi:hypothetical protein